MIKLVKIVSILWMIIKIQDKKGMGNLRVTFWNYKMVIK